MPTSDIRGVRVRRFGLGVLFLLWFVFASVIPAGADEDDEDDQACNPTGQVCEVVLPDCDDVGGCPDPLASCTVYA